MSTKPREQPEVSPCTFISQILVLQADDQDFDVNLVARDPDALIDMEMVKVRPGLNDEFKSLQSKFRARARNSDNVVEVVTFKTLQDWDSALSYFIYSTG